MPTEEDANKKTADERELEMRDVDLAEPGDDAALAEVRPEGEAPLATTEPTGGSDADADFSVPTQLGTRRFVYAAYFAGGICVAFLLSKMVSMGWMRLSVYKPELGEPHDEVVMPIAALIGALVAIIYYRDQKTRTLIEEVATELSKVTWPTRQYVINSTFVVIVTTLVATTFFALMDRFWGFVTNLVYGA